jgi:tetratricopeptide (TPR) repeat protein
MNKSPSFATTYKIEIAGFIALAILTSIAYSGIGNHQFLNWDDITYINENRHIHSITLNNLIWMFTNYEQQNWHPLTWLSFAINFEIWGSNALPFKVTNICIHILNSILVYFLTFNILYISQRNYHLNNGTYYSSLSKKTLKYASILIAIFFAIHPIHVESVTWIVERKDVLSAFFFFATILGYLKYRETHNDIKWFNISFFMFLCSLMSKPMGVTIPLVLILLDIYPLKLLKPELSLIGNTKILLSRKMSFFILSLLVASITLITQRGGIQDLAHMGLDSRLINAAMTVILYFYNFIWPTSLSPFYPFHHWSTEPNLYSFIPVSIFLVFTGYLLLLFKRKIQFPIIAWAFFLITLLPVIGIVKVGFQAAADRYTYIPLLSAYIAMGAGIALLIEYLKPYRLGRHALIIGAATIISFYMAYTYKQNQIWRADKPLWDYVISQYPGSASVGYSNLGTYYYTKSHFNEAILYFNKALELDPDNIDVMEKIAKTYELSKRDDLALPHYKQIIQAHPDSPRGYTLLGDFLYRRKNVKDAKLLYQKAFSLAPFIVSTMQRSALVDYLERDYSSAKEKLNYLLKLQPDDIGSLQLSAKIEIKLDNKKAAHKLAEKILALRHNDELANEILEKTSLNYDNTHAQ